MDIEKEREAFENHLKKMGKTDNETFSKNEDDSYQMDIIHFGWKIWQAAKAQAVPDTYTPIVLALEDVQSKIAQASFLTMDADNENDVYAVDANELHEYIAELIEAQEPAND